VDCIKNRVDYAEQRGVGETVDQRSTKSKFEIHSDSDDSDKSDEISNNSTRLTNRTDNSENDEKVEILSVQFNQNLNLLATGDSNGFVSVIKIHLLTIKPQSS